MPMEVTGQDVLYAYIHVHIYLLNIWSCEFPPPPPPPKKKGKKRSAEEGPIEVVQLDIQ